MNQIRTIGAEENVMMIDVEVSRRGRAICLEQQTEVWTKRVIRKLPMPDQIVLDS